VSTTSNIVVANNSTTATDYLPLFTTASGSSQAVSIDTGLTYNPNTNILTVGSVNGNASSATNISVLDRSTTAGTFYPTFVTGSGSAMTEGIDTGLTYDAVSNTLTAVNITATGTLSGTFGGTIADATNAANVYVTPTSTASNFYPTFVSTNTAGNKQEFLDTELTYNPNTNTLNVVNLTASGTITGTFGGTIGTATNANNIYVKSTNTAGT
jgi:hypothetical protein